MTPGDESQDELEAIAQAMAERTALDGRIGSAMARVDAREQEEQAAADGLGVVGARLRSLEHPSWTWLRTSVTGRRTEELMEARTAHAVGTSRAQAAQDRAAAARAELDQLRARLEGLSDLDARRERAVDARAQWLASTDPEVARALEDIATEVGAAREMLREVAEAKAAAAEADRELAAGAALLDSADGWSTYDTFFGGGMISSAIKHSRMDDASSVLRRADLALGRLSAELGDVGLPAVGTVEVSELTRTMDIWMDNIFSDLKSAGAIGRARERVAGARRAVADVGLALAARDGDMRRALTVLAGRKSALVDG